MRARPTVAQRRLALQAAVDEIAGVEVDRSRLFEAWRRAHRFFDIERPPRHAALKWERVCRLYSRRRVDAGWFFADWRAKPRDLFPPRHRRGERGASVRVALVLDGRLRVRVVVRGEHFEAAVAC